MEEKELSNKKRWFMATVVYLVMFVAFANQFKAPGLFSQLIPDIGFHDLAIGNVGWLMSCFSLLGLVFAFPASWFVQRVGIKKTLVLTVVCLVIGSVMGALVSGPYVLLVSRVVEGAGVGFLSVVAPSALTVLIPLKQRGLAFGIQGMTFPLGNVIGMNLGTIIGTAMGWRAAWWMGAAMALVVGVLLFWFKLPKELDRPGSREFVNIDESVKPRWGSIMSVGIVYMIWNLFWVGAFTTFYATFLQEQLAISATQASFMTTIPSIFMVVLGSITGMISDRIGSRKYLIIFCMAGSAILLLFGWNTNIVCAWVFLLGEGIFAPFITTGVMSIIPGLAQRPDKVSLGLGCMAFFKSIGMVVGSAIFTPIVSMVGYSGASQYYLAPICLIAVVLTVFGVKEKRWEFTARKGKDSGQTEPDQQ